MSRVVVDASVAIKWVVPEPGTAEALALLQGGGLCAPDLIVPECASILWKKTRRGELSPEEACLAARVIEQVELEILPTRSLLEPATHLANLLDHPAYDCIYLALAQAQGSVLITADERLLRRLAELGSLELKRIAQPLIRS